MNTAIRCARCETPKALNAFAIFAKKTDRVTGQVLFTERDTVCRRCRNEMYRGVPDDVVRWRTKEAALMKQLKLVREKIRTLTRIEAPYVAENDS